MAVKSFHNIKRIIPIPTIPPITASTIVRTSGPSGQSRENKLVNAL